jgi:hypothetical protein
LPLLNSGPPSQGSSLSRDLAIGSTSYLEVVSQSSLPHGGRQMNLERSFCREVKRHIRSFRFYSQGLLPKLTKRTLDASISCHTRSRTEPWIRARGGGTCSRAAWSPDSPTDSRAGLNFAMCESPSRGVHGDGVSKKTGMFHQLHGNNSQPISSRPMTRNILSTRHPFLMTVTSDEPQPNMSWSFDVNDINPRSCTILQAHSNGI